MPVQANRFATSAERVLVFRTVTHMLVVWSSRTWSLLVEVAVTVSTLKNSCFVANIIGRKKAHDKRVSFVSHAQTHLYSKKRYSGKKPDYLSIEMAAH